jgi:glycosyltransferase involved in cell wall biosynthesis
MRLYSIIIPAYNAERTLARTLDSIMNQTYINWECLVVNDGSTDNTCVLAQSFAQRDERFRILSQSNRGTAGAYNCGLHEAKSDWFCICSADDLLLPHHLENIDKYLCKSETVTPAILSTNGYFLYPDGTKTIIYSDGHEPEKSLEGLVMHCFHGVGAVCSKDAALSVGGFREGVYGEDWDLWLRLIARGYRHCYIPQISSVQYISPEQKSADMRQVYRSDIEILQHLRKTEKLSRSVMRALRASIFRRRFLLVRLWFKWLKPHS